MRHSSYAYTKRWRYDRARGLPRQVDPTPALEHAKMLLAAGGTIGSISDAAGISHDVLARLFAGRNQQIRRATAAKILAIQPRHLFNREQPDQLVPGVGTIRRLQALMAAGHTLATIAEAMGEPGKFHIAANLTKRQPRQVSLVNYQRAARAFDALWNVPGASVKAARMAQSMGYLPPLAWDDDTIDDPDAEPNLGEQARVNQGRPFAHVVDDVEFLLEHNPLITSTELAERLGYTSKSAIQHALAADRGNRPDLLARLARNASVAV